MRQPIASARGENREPNLFTRICGSTPSPDGNRWSKVRFAPDSSLEEDGFELLVPQSQEIILRAHRDRPSAPCSPRESDTPHERDRGFESASSSSESATKLASCIAAVPRAGEFIRVSRSLTSAKYRDPLNLDQHFRACETSVVTAARSLPIRHRSGCLNSPTPCAHTSGE